MKSIYKSRAYATTKVDYIKSQMQINGILNQNGINDIQHTLLSANATITFLKTLDVEGKKIKVGVKITIPNLTEKTRNQLYRALFHYLKAKFESLTFGFVEEYNEAFVKEFMPYIVADKSGKTISDLILPRLNNSAELSKSGEQLYLEEKLKEETKEEIEEEMPKEDLPKKEKFESIKAEYEEVEGNYSN